MIRLLTLLFSLVLMVGCKPEIELDLIPITTHRDGQVVADTSIVIPEGHAIGIQVIPSKNGEERIDWRVTATARGANIVEVAKTREDAIFVVTGKNAGQTSILFELKSTHTIRVAVEVTPRPEWSPSVPPLDDEPDGMAGSSSMGGANP